ncbi:MAG TPA: branched-chain amino acid ABC transporter permease/ATP-binding protein [Acidimicrobiales bacterium]|jgi:ABC-type branched-subunit amino acid transport system ATPase component/branched-subunit amino acid ABC-type transport system permease component|nr:branched-chain amino acid ABC transporter permease/ATP-binding protein [Acidimicrobiales bacterium]
MTTFLTYTVVGVVISCVYALSASGLVVTYTTSGVFNFAHGAIGMVAAFLYWQLTVPWGWPPLPALLFVLLVAAPLFGALVERVLVRRLEGASLEVNLVVTIGLMLTLIGVANLFWNPKNSARTVAPFFPGHRFKVFLVYVDYHQAIVVAVAIAVAVGLRLFFSRTRTGIAMRAVVDNRDLAEMAGARPVRIGQLSWALGAGLAALAGILLSPVAPLDAVQLTLLIIGAIGAAVVGRLRSLPMTVVGAFVIGLAVTYAVGYLPIGGFLSRIQGAIPMVVLFVALILMREERLRTGNVSSLQVPRVPGLRRSLIAAAAFVAVMVAVSGELSVVDLARGGRGLAMALILLSLVLLTGYAGQVSLCQMTFVGFGAYAMGHFGHHGSLLGVIAAVVLAGVVGAAVSLPTVRLRGLYLALATLAFAQAMDYIFFGQFFGSYGGGLTVSRVHLPGIPTSSDRAFFILLAVVFAVAAVGVLAIRRGRFGRRLAALNDAPAACATLGVNINYTKVIVFAASAGLAGLGGALYAGRQRLVTPNDFLLLLSLLLLLTLLIGGRNTVSGALLGALMLAFVAPILQDHFKSLSNLQYLLIGLGAVVIGQNPNGIGGQLALVGERLRARRSPRPTLTAVPSPASTARPAVPAFQSHTTTDEPGEILSVEDVSVRFGGVQALAEVTLSASRGRVTGLIGPNGAGKTTLFNVVTGLERPNSGSVRIAGEDVTGLAPYHRARLGLARTFQRLEIFGSLSARDNIRAAAEFHRGWARDGSDPEAVADSILDRLGLRAVADTRVDALPTGSARLVELGRALATEPRLLLLDEPGSGLDGAESEALGSLLVELAAGGMAVLLVEHDVDLVMRVCQDVYVLDFGRLIAHGTPREMQTDAVVQAAYLGDDPTLVVETG